MTPRGNPRAVPVILLKCLLHLAAFTPFVYLLFSVRTGGFSADPAKDIQHFTGLVGLKLLMATLLVSPLAKGLHLPQLLRCRRLLGIWCFTWATLHLLSYYFLELGVDNLSLLGQEIVRRPYLTLGLISWLLLFLLAITSFRRVQIRAGQRWQKLHNSIYLLAILIPVHYLWSVKAYSLQPFLWLAFAIILCALRLKKLWRKTDL